MIIPSLDFFDNKIVRLYQGNYNKKTYYDINPIACLNEYLKQGAQKLHIIDLIRVVNPLKNQIPLFINILKNISNIMVQIGGGIRTSSDIKTLLNIGIRRIVISSIAVEKPFIVKNWFKIFGPDILVLALDINTKTDNKYRIKINGWQKDSKITVRQVINFYNSVGLKHILCTDISKDGTLLGSNVALYEYMCNMWPNIQFQASGGVNNLNDIKKLSHTGVKSIIIGRAFLEKKFSISEAIKCWQKE